MVTFSVQPCRDAGLFFFCVYFCSILRFECSKMIKNAKKMQKNAKKCKKNAKKFAHIKKKLYLCTEFKKQPNK